MNRVSPGDLATESHQTAKSGAGPVQVKRPGDGRIGIGSATPAARPICHSRI